MSDQSVSLAAVFRRLAKRFKSRAYWEEPGYYTEGSDRDVAYAKRDVYEGVAAELNHEADLLEGNEDPSEP